MLKSQFIQKVTRRRLSEEDHLDLLPEGRGLSSQAKNHAVNICQAAVGIHCFSDRHDHLSLILIKRSEYDGKHSGQIAFPGGKMEASDPNLEYTARRECFEELGISNNCGILVRALTPVYIPVSNFEMTPFLFYHDTKPAITVNALEVVQVIELPILKLVHELPVINKDLVLAKNSLFQKSVPGFQFGEHWIWGATALVLNQLKKCLMEAS